MRKVSFPKNKEKLEMACKRATGTIEAALIGVIQNLSPIDIKDATGKTTDHFYKCSNPNNHVGLHMQDAIALDNKLQEIGRGAVFYPLYQTRMNLAPGQNKTPEEHMLTLMKEVGEVAEQMSSKGCPEVLEKEIHDVVIAAQRYQNCVGKMNNPYDDEVKG